MDDASKSCKQRFNLLDFTGEESAFGTGLPPWGKNHPKWELMMLRWMFQSRGFYFGSEYPEGS